MSRSGFGQRRCGLMRLREREYNDCHQGAGPRKSCLLHILDLTTAIRLIQMQIEWVKLKGGLGEFD